MNHRIEMEYSKLLQLSASGSIQQVQMQRNRLQTLDRNQEISADNWLKIDLVVCLRQRDSQKVRQILQQAESLDEMTFTAIESTLRLAPEAVSIEFLEWSKAVLSSVTKKKPPKSKGAFKLGGVAAMAIPAIALLLVLFGRSGSSASESLFELDTEALVVRVSPATMLYVQGIEFFSEEDGTRGWLPYSRGSAWAISSTRFVTNRHVVEVDENMRLEVQSLRSLGLKPSVKSYIFPVVPLISKDLQHAHMELAGGFVVAVPVTSPRLSGDHDLATGQGMDWTFDVTCETTPNLSQGQKITAVGFPAEADDLLQWSLDEALGPEQLDAFSFTTGQQNVVAIAADRLGAECFFPSVFVGQVSKIHETLPTFSHTAPAGGGASGSAIFDHYGRVVGLVTAGTTVGGIATANNIALRSTAVDSLFD